ncbi:MAG: hypothetical protein J7L96_05945 [Bacteroidales bacterium]|nr:hypothetical protein [Bacteroidales bacterium]
MVNQNFAATQTIIEGIVEIAKINSNAGVNADLTQTLRALLAEAAVARTAANVAIIQSQQFARGRYPVRGAIDGRLYQAAFVGPVRTGIYNKPVTINDRMDGGSFINSDYKAPPCDIGAHFSQHKFGRAADLKIEGVSPEEARLDITANWDLFKEKTALTTIEGKTPTWLHVDEMVRLLKLLPYLFRFLLRAGPILFEVFK